ncbi:MAG: SDR family oxidoreductase UcpA [Hespellia sp.]|nr:SDR family oxidoreductase UcpA [Hespellia sp.]
MRKLEGKVAMITGASKGIGEGIAKVYAGYGAKCVLAARGDKVLELAEELQEQGYDAIGVKTDVSDYESTRNLVETAVKQYGKIDVLVCNAGICVLEDFLSEDETFENRDKHIDINIKGVWNVTRDVLPELMKSKEGAIVIMSSVTGDMVADPGEVAYATSKAALVGFTKAMAREVAPYNIRVNAICPGYVLTPLVKGMAQQSDPESPERAIQAIAGAVPLGRLADPKEVGELAAFLGCRESSYITGTQIVIDGGSTLPETSSMGQ